MPFLVLRRILESAPGETSLNKHRFCRVQMILLENVPDFLLFTPIAIMILLVNASHLEIISQNTMTYAKLRQLANDATRHGTHKGFQ